MIKQWGGLTLAAAFAVLAAVSFFSFSRERKRAEELRATNQSLNATLAQVKGGMQNLADKITQLEMQNVTPPSAPPARSAAPAASQPRRPAVTSRQPDPRLNRIQARLTEQEKEIAGTKDQINQTREELQGKLSSVKDDLSGSIARTHEELAALQKRGERNYHEFYLDKSKQFSKVGPIRISLRKVDIKRKRYDMVMLVEDYQIEKKNVNIFEPVWITVPDRSQPLELVVNDITKNQASGYLSEPRFSRAELSAPRNVNAKPGPQPPK
jgi:hypothetical protein